MEIKKKAIIAKNDVIAIQSIIHEDFFSDYLGTFIDGKHKAEILADAALREGKDKIADEIMGIYETMAQLKRGDYESALQYLTECPVYFDNLHHSKGTKFESAVKDLASPVERITDILAETQQLDNEGRATIDIDFKASAKLLRSEKERRFSEHLSMIEKLNKWNAEKNNDIRIKR